jgi:hypothetical protein
MIEKQIVDKNIHSSTLTHYLDVITKNFSAIKESFPKLYLAAEELNDLFDQLFTRRVVPEEELWQQESLQMLFGCFSSWSHAFVMTAAGLGEHGMTSVRRAIEFVCYIAKINGSNERAALLAWTKREHREQTPFLVTVFNTKVLLDVVLCTFEAAFGVARSYIRLRCTWELCKSGNKMEG